jgi:hypothetical protein
MGPDHISTTPTTPSSNASFCALVDTSISHWILGRRRHKREGGHKRKGGHERERERKGETVGEWGRGRQF